LRHILGLGRVAQHPRRQPMNPPQMARGKHRRDARIARGIAGHQRIVVRL
jgi:hypothetical protein